MPSMIPKRVTEKSDISGCYFLGDELWNKTSVENISHGLLNIRKSQIFEAQIHCFSFISFYATTCRNK